MESLLFCQLEVKPPIKVEVDEDVLKSWEKLHVIDDGIFNITLCIKNVYEEFLIYRIQIPKP